jgi:hypothetical protein
MWYCTYNLWMMDDVLFGAVARGYITASGDISKKAAVTT